MPRREATEFSTPSVVLLVEDDRDGRRLYAEWLTAAGFAVEQAHNGLQALERAVDAKPDVVVTDLNIPGIDGFELTRRLRQPCSPDELKAAVRNLLAQQQPR